MVQELVSLNHGISLVPHMARCLDQSKLRVYRSLVAPKPSRRIVMVTNPYRYQSKLQKQFEESLRTQAQEQSQPRSVQY
jgi:LysR family hydrogen peroxide-inducible transcriptional activator